MSTEPRVVAFGDRKVGFGQPVFVTFEAGPTHSGVESAKRLIDEAARAGADAIKFQMTDPDRLVSDRKQLFEYDVLLDKETGARETVREPLYDILCRRALSQSQWQEVKAHADARGLAFFATVPFVEQLEFLAELGCDSVKIASADVNHFPLIRRAARTGMCLQLDTGNSSIGEIEAAIDAIREEGSENIIIHHCPSGYPARLESINLNIIPTLKRMFPYPVAFSDHTPSWEMDVAAVALGADLVEKTITEDRTTRSIEHIMSIEPPEMKEFVRILRDIQTALGRTRRVMFPEERRKRDAVRRSAFLARDVAKGDTVDETTIEFRRPGYGISPALCEQFFGRTFARPLEAGHLLDLTDIA